MSTKKNKFSIYIYVVITIIGCVLACSSIVPNDYLKLVVVMGALGVGLYGIMKGLSQLHSNNGRNQAKPRKNKRSVSQPKKIQT